MNLIAMIIGKKGKLVIIKNVLYVMNIIHYV